MNLHSVVRPAIGAINPDLVGTLFSSTGYTTAANGKQIPTYSRIDNVLFQVQPLSSKDIEHLDSLNIQNASRAVYVNRSDVKGLDRKTGRGGDLLIFLNTTWLVVTVLEPWDSNGWTKVAVTQQTDAVS